MGVEYLFTCKMMELVVRRNAKYFLSSYVRLKPEEVQLLVSEVLPVVIARLR